MRDPLDEIDDLIEELGSGKSVRAAFCRTCKHAPNDLDKKSWMDFKSIAMCGKPVEVNINRTFAGIEREEIFDYCSNRNRDNRCPDYERLGCLRMFARKHPTAKDYAFKTIMTFGVILAVGLVLAGCLMQHCGKHMQYGCNCSK